MSNKTKQKISLLLISVFLPMLAFCQGRIYVTTDSLDLGIVYCFSNSPFVKSRSDGTLRIKVFSPIHQDTLCLSYQIPKGCSDFTTILRSDGTYQFYVLDDKKNLRELLHRRDIHGVPAPNNVKIKKNEEVTTIYYNTGYLKAKKVRIQISENKVKYKFTSWNENGKKQSYSVSTTYTTNPKKNVIWIYRSEGKLCLKRRKIEKRIKRL